MKKLKYFLIITIFIQIVCLLFPIALTNIDGRFHELRMIYIYTTIKNFDFSFFVAEDALNGFGYACLGFYPYLLMIPFSLLQFFSISSYWCLFVYAVFLKLLIVFSSYLFAKDMLLDKKKILVFVFFYINNPIYLNYQLLNNYGMICAP